MAISGFNKVGMTHLEKLFEKIRNQEKLNKKELALVESALKKKEWKTFTDWSSSNLVSKTKYIKTESFRVKGVKTFEEIPKSKLQ